MQDLLIIILVELIGQLEPELGDLLHRRIGAQLLDDLLQARVRVVVREVAWGPGDLTGLAGTGCS